MREIEATAREFAERAHGDQRYGDQPYVTHLAAVRAVLADFEVDGALGVAAWLHDVVEDTPVSVEDVTAAFGAEVAALVWAVTGVGANRAERNAAAYAKIEQLPAAVTLKLADRIANTEASVATSPELLAMYRREYPAFKAHLEPAAAGDATAARMWARLDALSG